MKDLITKLNKLFDHRIRLGIMSILMVNDRVDFNHLKEMLNATDGNLASHLKGLEKAKFIGVQKKFIGRKPNTSYFATEAGRAAFKEHLNALEKILNSTREDE